MVECHQTSFDDLHTQSMLYFGKTHQWSDKFPTTQILYHAGS